MNLIEARDLRKRFVIPSERRDTIREQLFALHRRRRFQTLQVLDGVSLSLARGETLGIMGRNGCGKSTLLKILAGIYQPDGGTLTIGAPVTAILELGVGWNPELDAVDNVHLLGTVMGMTLGEVRAALPGVLAFAEVERFAHLPLKHYSTGMAARLASAVAFRAARDVLILDEMLAVGDAAFRAKCEVRYRELMGEGRSGILVSHTPQTVASFCDRVILLEGGRIVMEGPPAAVIDRYHEMLAAPPATPW